MNAPTPNFTRRVSKETRRPFGSQSQKLAYEARAGYHRHWFNEIPGRIDDAITAGYTHVEDKDGKKVCRVVGVNQAGGSLTSYLMEIPEEWYQEDMARQQKAIDDMDDAIRRGKVEEQPGDNRYIPSQGIQIRSSGKKN